MRGRFRASVLIGCTVVGLALAGSSCGSDEAESGAGISEPAAADAGETTGPETTDESGADGSEPGVAVDAADESDADDPAPLATRPFAVVRDEVTYVDTSRGTPAGAETEAIENRTIEVLIDRPDTTEPRPLVVFAHGIWGHPRYLSQLRAHLAAEGFVVAAPVFPLTNRDVPGAIVNGFDTEAQSGDVSFVVDQVLADPELGPLVDPERIGAIGHSLGGATVAGAGLSVGGDDRFGAVVIMAAGFGEIREGVSVLVAHGDADSVVPFSIGHASYSIATGRRMLLTLHEGGHITGIEDDDTAAGDILRGVAAAFFAHELGVEAGHVAALDELPFEGVSVEAADGREPLDDWRSFFASAS